MESHGSCSQDNHTFYQGAVSIYRNRYEELRDEIIVDTIESTLLHSDSHSSPDISRILATVECYSCTDLCLGLDTFHHPVLYTDHHLGRCRVRHPVLYRDLRQDRCTSHHLGRCKVHPPAPYTFHRPDRYTYHRRDQCRHLHLVQYTFHHQDLCTFRLRDPCIDSVATL
jgi:hypothetical protein